MDNLSEKIETVKLDFLNRFFRQLCHKRLKIRRIDIVEERLAVVFPEKPFHGLCKALFRPAVPVYVDNLFCQPPLYVCDCFKE